MFYLSSFFHENRHRMIPISSRADEVSEFVREAMDSPLPDEFDWWLESVPAALFSTGFEMFNLIAYAETSSENDFDILLHQFISELANKASIWVEERCNETSPIKAREGTFVPRIEQRLYSYFAIGIKSMADRDYDVETARSHSCFVILSKVLEELAKVDRHLSPKQARDFLENMMDLCKGWANDMHGALQRIFNRHDT